MSSSLTIGSTRSTGRGRVQATMLDELLRIPYTMVVMSVRKPDGTWTRRVEYPELGHCAVESNDILWALDRVEELRVALIQEAVASGDGIPRPRPPLRRVQGPT